METSFGLNIVIVPSPEISSQVCSWSRQISEQFSTKFILDGVNYFPHLTLYQSTFIQKNIPSLKAALKTIADTSAPLSITMTEIKAYVDYVFYHASLTPTLYSLHEKILNAVAPLHDPSYTVPPELIQGFPAFFAENIKKYGTALAKQDYLPHITLTRCQNSNDAKAAAQSIPPQSLSMIVNAIYLTTIDHDGTCKKIIETFPLSSSL